MECPKCGQLTGVADSRPLENNTKIRRRRKCDQCRFVFTTYETSEEYQTHLSQLKRKLETIKRLL